MSRGERYEVCEPFQCDRIAIVYVAVDGVREASKSPWMWANIAVQCDIRMFAL